MALESLNAARMLDGLPPVPDLPPVPMDAEFLRVPSGGSGELNVVEIEGCDEVYMVSQKKKPEIAMGKLSMEDKEKFYAAKRKALDAQTDNGAWKPAQRSDAPIGNLVPMRFLLKWKTMPDESVEANARVIYQGFKLADVTNQPLDTQAPTLSRVSRNCLFAVATHRKWRLFNGDIKAAFHQADDLSSHGMSLYGEPDRFMREHLGLADDQVLHMIKPPFGDPRSPKLWHKKATEILLEAGMVQHRLDQCFWLSHDLHGKLNGMLGLHVDDVVGGGDEQGPFAKKIEEIRAKLRFGHWKIGADFVFCGVLVRQNATTYEISLTQVDYIQKVKPLTVKRKEKPNEGPRPLDPGELRQYMGLIGAMQWPAAQSMPHGAASISLLQARSKGATTADATEANKTLRFLKENADIPMKFSKIVDEDNDFRLGVYTDASWASRPDSSSQGGYYVFLFDQGGMDGQARPLMCLDWGSRKLPRVCRSSLSAESQACATAVDRLEWCVNIMVGIFAPNVTPGTAAAYNFFGQHVVVTDSRGLYDASHSQTAGLGVQDKRTAIEVMIINERMSVMNAGWRWTSADQQLSDGLTKVQTRQVLADMLRRGYHMLIFDPNAKAGKKKTDADRQNDAERLRQGAKEWESRYGTVKNPEDAMAATVSPRRTSLLRAGHRHQRRLDRVLGALAVQAALSDALPLTTIGQLTSHASYYTSYYLDYELFCFLAGVVGSTLVLLLFLAALLCAWCVCRGRSLPEPARPKKVVRDMGTQAQCTYDRPRSRFRYLDGIQAEITTLSVGHEYKLSC